MYTPSLIIKTFRNQISKINFYSEADKLISTYSFSSHFHPVAVSKAYVLGVKSSSFKDLLNSETVGFNSNLISDNDYELNFWIKDK